MKKFIVALAFVLSTSVFAESLAPHETIATLIDINEEVASIAADNYGVVTIAPRHSRVLIKKQVSAKTRERLFELASILASAEIKTERRTMICKMVPPRYQPMLSVSSQQGQYFTGELHRVLSTLSCAIANVTYPKDDYMMEYAIELRNLLTVLSNEYGTE